MHTDLHSPMNLNQLLDVPADDCPIAERRFGFTDFKFDCTVKYIMNAI